MSIDSLRNSRMSRSPSDPTLEPVVAHGARMSWAGLLRPGDAFARPRRTRMATLRSTSGSPLVRFYGSWSDRYQRFTLNLSSSDLSVKILEPGTSAIRGIRCLVHWIRPSDLVSTGSGSACRADGWPVELWTAFQRHLGSFPEGTVAEKLQGFLRSELGADVPAVASWRSLLRGKDPQGVRESHRQGGWLPVPALLEGDPHSRACVVSWSPSKERFDSLSAALHSPESSVTAPDLASQARYHLECTLGRMHGVEFGPDDQVEDREFEHTPAWERLAGPLRSEEARKLEDPEYGRLDHRG